jgi:hypothetical protein
MYNSVTLYRDSSFGEGVEFNIKTPTQNYYGNTLFLSADPQTGAAPKLTNDGVINVLGAGNSSSTWYYSSFNTANGALLTGSGRLVMNGNRNSQLNASGSTGLTQDVNHTIEGGGMISGKLVNNGTLLANNGNLVVLANVSGTGQVKVQDGGRLIAGQTGYYPITLQTKDLLMSQNANINVGFSSTVNVTGHFSYAMTDPSKWVWASDSTLKMSGPSSGYNFLEAGGSKFVIPYLDISGNIALEDLFNNSGGSPPEALYVTQLHFSGSDLNLNGCSLYVNGNLVDINDPNFTLNFPDFVGHITNQPLNPVPLPPTALLLGSGLLGLVGWRRLRQS